MYAQTLRNFLHGRAVDGTIVVCAFNFGYTMMLLNMLCRLNQLGIKNYVIVAVDAEAWRCVLDMPHRIKHAQGI